MGVSVWTEWFLVEVLPAFNRDIGPDLLVNLNFTSHVLQHVFLSRAVSLASIFFRPVLGGFRGRAFFARSEGRCTSAFMVFVHCPCFFVVYR